MTATGTTRTATTTAATATGGDAAGAAAPLRRLRLGVVGIGQRAEIAEWALAPEMAADIVVCADPTAAGRARARAAFGADVTLERDHRALVGAGLDGVFITSPDHTHEQIAVDLLDAGLPVFLEKPMAITTAGCDRILAASAASGATVFVGHNMRHMPVVTAMRDLVLAGAVGEVQAVWCRHFVGNGGDYYFKDWHAERANTTGLLLQKGAHDIDVIHWLAGGRSTRVTAMGALKVYGRVTDRRAPALTDDGEAGGLLMADWFDPETNWPPLAATGLNPVVDVEDVSMMLMELDNGVLASYQQCHFTPDYWRNYTVIGTEGRLENFGDTDGATVKVWNRRSGYRADADTTIEIPPGGRSHGGADPLLVEEFLDRVRGNPKPSVSSPIAARDAVAAGCAATGSLRDGGRPVDVPPVSADLLRAFA